METRGADREGHPRAAVARAVVADAGAIGERIARTHRFAPRMLAIFAAFVAVPSASAADRYDLSEPANDARIFSFVVTLRASGSSLAAAENGKAVSLPLEVQARIAGRERRLDGTGREAAAFRFLRRYDEAATTNRVGGQTTGIRLRDERRLVVVQGVRDGLEAYAVDGPLTFREAELLDPTGDGITALPLLPPKPVAVGETWTPDTWAAQMLGSVEAVSKSDLTCKLASVEGRRARIEFSGNVEGATYAAPTKVSVLGHLVYDVQDRCVVHVELEQTEKRSIGTVDAGVDAKSVTVVERRPVAATAGLGDEVVTRVPLDPTPQQRMLVCGTPWNVRFLHDRGWRTFHQSDRMAILRLMEAGNLVAQCNLTPIPSAKAGDHTPLERFRQDVQVALGDKLKQVIDVREIPAEPGHWIGCVVAVGEGNGLEMTWAYYLCAAPDGRQMAFVFAVEHRNRERLGTRDLEIVRGLEFLPVAAAKLPTPAAP